MATKTINECRKCGQRLTWSRGGLGVTGYWIAGDGRSTCSDYTNHEAVEVVLLSGADEFDAWVGRGDATPWDSGTDALYDV